MLEGKGDGIGNPSNSHLTLADDENLSLCEEDWMPKVPRGIGLGTGWGVPVLIA